MNNWLKKLITVPISNGTKEVEAIQLWEVRWMSRHGALSFEEKPEVEAFPTEAEATYFATALRQAFTLIRHTHHISVTVTRAR